MNISYYQDDNTGSVVRFNGVSDFEIYRHENKHWELLPPENSYMREVFIGQSNNCLTPITQEAAAEIINRDAEQHRRLLRKKKLIESFEQTQRRIAHDAKIAAATEQAIQNTVLYENWSVSHTPKSEHQKNSVISIEVVEDTTFSAAQKLKAEYEKVTVLNFASPVNPGGGVTIGAMAQEECLCRSSNLYPCLTKPELFKPYYQFHRNQGDCYYSDKIIYSKDVLVFQSDDDIPQHMNQSSWFQVDVITCAAPNMRGISYINYLKVLLIYYLMRPY